jgi:hypothetical protein
MTTLELKHFIGLAVSDKKEQIIISTRAVGDVREGTHFPQMPDGTLNNLREAGVKKKKMIMLADKNYFSEENLKACKERGAEAVTAGLEYRKRLETNENRKYEADDFKYNKKVITINARTGKSLPAKKTDTVGGHEGKAYKADVKDCRVCRLSSKCLKSKKEPDKLTSGRGLFISGSNSARSLIRVLRKKLNTQEYQGLYAYRIQITEPVFSNIACCKKPDRFSLCGREKVNGQWHLYCMVHNLGKCLKGYNLRNEYA